MKKAKKQQQPFCQRVCCRQCGRLFDFCIFAFPPNSVFAYPTPSITCIFGASFLSAPNFVSLLTCSQCLQFRCFSHRHFLKLKNKHEPLLHDNSWFFITKINTSSFNFCSISISNTRVPLCHIYQLQHLPNRNVNCSYLLSLSLIHI